MGYSRAVRAGTPQRHEFELDFPTGRQILDVQLLLYYDGFFSPGLEQTTIAALPAVLFHRDLGADGTATVSYSLSNSAGGRFAIDAYTGVVTVADGSLLDYEAATAHGIVVRATSSDGSTTDTAFAIALAFAGEPSLAAGSIRVAFIC